MPHKDTTNAEKKNCNFIFQQPFDSEELIYQISETYADKLNISRHSHPEFIVNIKY